MWVPIVHRSEVRTIGSMIETYVDWDVYNGVYEQLADTDGFRAKRGDDLAEERLDARHLLLVVQEEGVRTQGSVHGSADMVVADALGAVEVSGVGVRIAARHGREVVQVAIQRA